jgi:hypothetical protein
MVGILIDLAKGNVKEGLTWGISLNDLVWL